MDNLFLQTGIHAVSPSISISAVSRHNASKSSVVTPPAALSSSKFSFKLPFRSLWPKCKTQRQNGLALEDDAVLVDAEEEQQQEQEGDDEGREKNVNVNWVMKILHVKSLWKNQKQGEDDSVVVDNDDGDVCRVDYDDDDDDDDDDEREIEFDRESFSRMLRRVSLTDAKLYAKMTHLSNLAYSIPSIQPGNLLKTQGLRFVTSSIEKRELAAMSERCQVLAESQDVGKSPKDEVDDEQPNIGSEKNPYVAYQVAASAASYLQSQTKSLLRFRSSNSEVREDGPKDARDEFSSFDITKTDVSNLKATTESVTAVVAAKEEVKQAVADDLSSNKSSPCEWFICDDDQTGTRFFAIQGSESLASWKANLLFEPIKFEGMDVLVHRGIYEAAKGIYEQMLPEIRSHLQSRKRATFRFTGHSLGGSLAVLVSLMLLLRNEVPASSLLPVITFGSPSIMCGGDKLLHKLGLPKGHVQAIVMHRDIVPRAFSCQYPNHVAGFLKALNRNFCNHPCLNTQKLLYTPMGELLILQPDAKLSPCHGLLPLNSGLYHLSGPLSDPTSTEKLLRSAQMVFFNSPHPLEILSDRNAYGSGGTIQRNHDMKSYLKSVRDVICQDLKRMRKAERERSHKVWWSLMMPHDVDGGIVVGRSIVSSNIGQEQFTFSGILQNGKNSLKRFSRLVASQHMHMLVVLLVPARTLLLDAYNVINFH